MAHVERMKERREAVKMFQHILAQKSGVSIRTIARMENKTNGKGNLSTVKLIEAVLTAEEKKQKKG